MTNTQEVDDFGGDAPEADEKTAIKRIAPMVRRRLELQQKIAALTAELKTLTDEDTRIETVDLPALMDELGISGVDVPMPDGRHFSVKITEDIHASLPVKDPEKRRRGIEWLRKNKHGSIVKRGFSIKFGNSAREREAAEAFATYLAESPVKIAVEDKDEVHHGSLTSLVKELLKKPGDHNEMLQVLGAHKRRIAVIVSEK